ncbi:hypothetical protein DMENIID0001_149570 [Sergentomyia squamirostris]
MKGVNQFSKNSLELQNFCEMFHLTSKDESRRRIEEKNIPSSIFSNHVTSFKMMDASKRGNFGCKQRQTRESFMLLVAYILPAGWKRRLMSINKLTFRDALLEMNLSPTGNTPHGVNIINLSKLSTNDAMMMVLCCSDAQKVAIIE